MRKVKEILRLSLGSKLPYDQIGQALGPTKGAISKYVKLASAAGLGWAGLAGYSDHG